MNSFTMRYSSRPVDAAAVACAVKQTQVAARPMRAVAVAIFASLFTLGWGHAQTSSASAQQTPAKSQALIEGQSVAITVQDMQADSVRMPPEMRSVVLQKPETVLQVASNLYARRVFAEKALVEGLDKDPQVQAILKVARDKILSDAMLEYIDKKSVPDDAALEGLARNIYRANPDRFKAGEEVSVSHIMISGDSPESRAKAQQVLDELKKGADFAVLAKERSADTGSAAKGGDLGFFGKGRMVPPFETAAFALQKPGDLSDLVQTQFGFHVLKLNDKRAPRLRSFDEVKDELVKEVRTKAAQDARAAEAEKIQQSAKVNQDAVNAFAESYKQAGSAGK
ncbi:MAG: peptidylprolyl isomerase [Acidovorax sp.]